MTKIPKAHPRYLSLITREKISEAEKKGFVHKTGLIAHGRGEAFDYLIGEKTLSFADNAEKTAAATLIYAKNPVISVNGNVVALSAEEIIRLSKKVNAKIEVNLFHRTDIRMKKLVEELESKGAKEVCGLKADAHIPGLDHDRGLCDKDGIYSSDAVLVPLEDGDRCQALKNMEKKVITIDLNPLSRTAKTADITIVDNIVRAIPNITNYVELLKSKDKKDIEKIILEWDNKKMLKEVCSFISKRLNSLF